MDHPTLYAVLAFFLLLIAPLVAQPWIEKVRHHDQLREKHGQLVEDQSGVPIADAAVVFQFIENRGPDAGCMIARAATTDSSGRFVLPDVTFDLSFDRTWLRNVGGLVSLWGYYLTTYNWTLAVYAPGFAMVSPDAPHQTPSNLVYRILNLPGVSTNGVFNLPPVKLARTSFTPVDEISYLARLTKSLECGWRSKENPPEIVSVRDQIAQRVRRLPCEMPPTTMISGRVVAEYALALDYQARVSLSHLEGDLAPVDWKTELAADVVCKAGNEMM